jgi:hypothetical protein
MARKPFGADVPAPPDATKLDGTTKATLARLLSALPPGERDWITFAETRANYGALMALNAAEERRRNRQR